MSALNNRRVLANMARAIPIIGKKYSRLTVVATATSTSDRRKWECICDCGRVAIVAGTHLRSGATQSCGCLQKDRVHAKRFIDITGRHFGRLVVLSLASKRECGEYRWSCRCECGRITVADGAGLKSGNTKSCGCLRRDMTSAAILIDLTGRTIQGWTVLGRAKDSQPGRPMWNCRHKDGRLHRRNGNALLVEADPSRLFVRTCRTRILEAFKRQSVGKNCRSHDLLGCTGAELVAHLAAQFEPGMTLENHGEWHIDHKRPIASFDLTNPEQVKACFHYSNLQPLWAKHNLAKSDRLDWSHPTKQSVESGVVA